MPDDAEVVLHYNHVDYAAEVSGDVWRIVRWGRDVVAETLDHEACAAAFRLLSGSGIEISIAVSRSR